VQRFGLRHETRELLGTNFHHLVIPAPAGEADPEVPPILARLGNAPTHLYWIEEGDYLLLSGVPQTLMDYRYAAQKVAVGDWLSRDQRVDASGALFLASTRLEGTPALLYEINLLFLSALGDLVGRPLDLFAFPSARELRLPGHGAYSLMVTSTAEALGAELAYEGNPLEILLGLNGMQAAAVAGLLAAIALPAYQDHQEGAAGEAGEPRGDAGDQGETDAEDPLVLLGDTQLAVARFHAEEGHFPGTAELGAEREPLVDTEAIRIVVEPDTGTLHVVFLDAGEGATLILTPEAKDGGLVWRCAGPAMARAGAICQP